VLPTLAVANQREAGVTRLVAHLRRRLSSHFRDLVRLLSRRLQRAGIPPRLLFLLLARPSSTSYLSGRVCRRQSLSIIEKGVARLRKLVFYKATIVHGVNYGFAEI